MGQMDILDEIVLYVIEFWPLPVRDWLTLHSSSVTVRAFSNLGSTKPRITVFNE